MSSYQEQFSVATRAQLESQLNLFSTLFSKTVEGVEKVVGLNLSAAKASLERSNAAAQQLLAAKDMQEFFHLSQNRLQASPETGEDLLAYSRNLASILSGLQAELTRITETQYVENNRKVIALMEELTKNAPAGSETAVNLFKTAIGNASAGYEHLNKTAKQAVETIEANFNNAATQMAQATAKAARPAKK